MTTAARRDAGDGAAPLGFAPPATPSLDEGATLSAVADRVARTGRSLALLWEDVSTGTSSRDGELSPETVLDLLLGLLGTRGKRLRPRMAHWGWVAAGGLDHGHGYDDLVTACAALELLHAFALVHDDVMDESLARRGRPSVHALAASDHEAHGGHGAPGRYGDSIAILVGDLLHSEADLLAADLPGPLRAAWRVMTVELIAGQTHDIVGATNGQRDLEHARRIARAKSGAYTVWRPLQLGAIAAGAGDDTLEALHAFGHHVGEAFALRDDILGVLGDPERTGKPVGDDIVAGKPTVLLALADKRFSPTWRLLLRHAGASGCTTDEAEAIAAELVSSGVVAEVEDMISASVAAAERVLADPAISPAAAMGLRALAHRVAWRDT
jgi:geranylgeranyl diphosphate synthase type I